jgi:ankyrin repeat protein
MRDGEVELARSLLQAGANPNLREKDQPALLEAVTLRDPEVVRLLLERGADLKSVDSSGTTALMVAAFNGDVQIAKMLLDHGASPATRDGAGVTAAEYARDSPAIAAMIRASSGTTSKGSAQRTFLR